MSLPVQSVSSWTYYVLISILLYMLAIIIKRLYKEKNICNNRTGFVVKWFTNKFMHGMIKLPE